MNPPRVDLGCLVPVGESCSLGAQATPSVDRHDPLGRRRGAGVVTIVGVERPTTAGREIVAIVLSGDGAQIGEQVKTQIDPTEEPHYVAGSGRRTFTVGDVTFAVAICHEAFRYPEIARAAALDGAQVLFVPHFVTTGDGSLPERWCDATNPYNEKAVMCRALENTIYVAAANVAGADQGSASCIIAPRLARRAGALRPRRRGGRRHRPRSR